MAWSSKRRSSSSSSSNTRSSIFSMGCGCKDSKSIPVTNSLYESPILSSRPPPPTRETSIEFSSSSFRNLPRHDYDGSQSFSGLLRQLDHLEKTVLSLPQPTTNTNIPRRRRTKSEGGGGRAALEEGVAVVKETEDPLGDFRRSMLQMIFEKEILGKDELRRLLQRFLSINSPAHHPFILRAFAGIWNELFSGGLGQTTEPPDQQLRRSRSATCYPPPRPLRGQIG